MGTWGLSIRGDDTVLDIREEFKDLIKTRQSIKLATEELIKIWKDEISDPDDGPIFWLGLAEVQWEYGGVDKKVLAKVKSDFKLRRGLGRWTYESEKLAAKRLAVIEKFIKKVERPNPSKKPIPKQSSGKSIFSPGDCLSVRLSDGRYAAALVTAAEQGHNFIVQLDYLSRRKPSLDEFLKRKWLRLNYGNWKNTLYGAWYERGGYGEVKSTIEIVGSIPLQKKDPMKSRYGFTWDMLGREVVWREDWMKQQKRRK